MNLAANYYFLLTKSNTIHNYQANGERGAGLDTEPCSMPTVTPTKEILWVMLVTERECIVLLVATSTKETSLKTIVTDLANSNSTMDPSMRATFAWAALKDSESIPLMEATTRVIGNVTNTMDRADSSTRMAAITKDDSSVARLTAMAKNASPMEAFAVACGVVENSSKSAQRRNA